MNKSQFLDNTYNQILNKISIVWNNANNLSIKEMYNQICLIVDMGISFLSNAMETLDFGTNHLKIARNYIRNLSSKKYDNAFKNNNCF